MFDFTGIRIPAKEKENLLNRADFKDQIYTIYLSEDEYKLCIEETEKRLRAKRRNVPTWNTSNRNMPDGYSNAIGILSEFAYSKWSGIKMNTEVYVGHGDKSDFGFTEIKASTYFSCTKIALKMTEKEWNKSFKNQNLAIFLTRLLDGHIVGQNYCRIDFIGWISLRRFHLLHSKERFNNQSHDNLVVYPHHLCKVMPSSHAYMEQLCLKDNLNIEKIFKATENSPLSVRLNYLNEYTSEYVMTNEELKARVQKNDLIHA